MKRASWISASAVTAIWLATCAPTTWAVGVFAVADTYSIQPDGSCTEIVGGQLNNLASTNGHWDAGTRTVKLYAAKNEEVAVQIVIPAEGGGYRAVMSPLKGPGSIAPDRVTVSAVVWAQSPTGDLLHDVIIPLDGTVAGVNSMKVPFVLKGMPEVHNTVGVLLVEVWVPKDAPAGLYAGTLRILLNDSEVDTLNVNLTVFDLTLPDQPTFAFELLTYSLPSAGLGESWRLVSGEGVPLQAFPATERARKINHQVYKLAADNRCFVNNLPYHSQRGSPVSAYPIAGQGTEARITSFKEFDDFFDPILSGKLNKFGKGPAHFMLAFNANYPHVCHGNPTNQFNWMPYQNSIPDGPGKSPGLKEFEDTNKAIAEQTLRHFAEKGWKDTIFEFYHNQKPDTFKNRGGSRNRLCWKLDEPTDKQDYQALRYFLAVNKWSVETVKHLGIRTATRIDAGHFHCNQTRGADGSPVVCETAASWDTENAKSLLEPVVDHWVLGLVHADATRHLLPSYEHPGTKLETYTVMPLRQGVNACVYRSEGFRAARRGTVGQVYFKLDIKNGNPANTGGGATGSYAEYTLYDGTKVGIDGALAARRLKLWRNSVNDFDYIAQARAKDPTATQSVIEQMTFVAPLNGKIHTSFATITGNNNPESYLAARLSLARIITHKSATAIPERSKAFLPTSEPDGITNYD